MKTFFQWLGARLREPSTHAALAALAGGTGLGIVDEGTVRDVLLGIAAVLAVVGATRKEQPS